jgi:non-specific serine/threonine protein kinase
MNPFSVLLRAQPTPLLGRADELETIRQRLVADGVRLLTLTGPAGVGKTRLALTAAAQVTDHFPDGVTLVDLTPIREPLLVVPTIAQSFGLTDAGTPPLAQRLQEFLGERERLLVLDNFEQVLPAAATLADLLAGCPRLRLLVTSRVPLRLRWEWTLRVSPLPVPDLGAALPPVGELRQIPAVALFVERAQAHRADFALTEAQAPLVAQLVVHLDGLPLALELAATRLDALSLPTFVRRLEDCLPVFRWDAPDLPERQRSLEAAVGWSYELLSAGEQRLFRCMGVFVGRVALDAIAAVVAGTRTATNERDETGETDKTDVADAGDAGHTLQTLASLVEKSLVLPERLDAEEDDAAGEPAFGVLETVREYAVEQLARHGELAAARHAHASYFLALAERADPQLRGHGQRAWFFRLEREHDNLRAALRWLLDQNGLVERESVLRLAGALAWFWWMRGYHAEGRRWLKEALRRAPEADVSVRTRALLGAGRILMQQGDYERARAELEEALALARRRDPATGAEALTHQGACAVYAGDWAEGARLLREALSRSESLGDPYWSGTALYLLGAAVFAQGHDAEAAVIEADGLDRLEAMGEARVAGTAHFGLAVIMRALGDLSRAIRHVQIGLEVSAALQDHWLLSIGARAALLLLGERAATDRRARLLGASDALRRATGATAVWERVVTDRDVARLREQIEREGWGAVYHEGRSLPFGEVATLALAMLEDFAQAPTSPDLGEIVSPSAPEPPHRQESLLSTREQEVLRLVAQGMSNKAIGRRLFISASTVNYHMTSTFHKLGVDTRAQAVAVAAQRGLL